ncbi:MAG: hypothetical protein KBD78_12170 [Oligoflexales bacterium]|nr:hypothetical protein [Oligoflexales bacterium]
MLNEVDIWSLIIGFVVYLINYLIFFALAEKFIFGAKSKASFLFFYLFKNLVLAGLILTLVLVYSYQAFSLAIGMMAGLFVVTLVTIIFRN